MLNYELKERIDNLYYILNESKFEYMVTQEKDKSLKSLFEVKRQFIQLIKTFVKEKWTEKLTEENVVYNYFEENLKRKEKEDMALADLVPGAWEIIREEYRAEGRVEGQEEGKIIQKRAMLIKMLNKKIKDGTNKKVLMCIEKASIEKLDKIEDNIFEITSWEEVEDIINN